MWLDGAHKYFFWFEILLDFYLNTAIIWTLIYETFHLTPIGVENRPVVGVDTQLKETFTKI